MTTHKRKPVSLRVLLALLLGLSFLAFSAFYGFVADTKLDFLLFLGIMLSFACLVYFLAATFIIKPIEQFSRDMETIAESGAAAGGGSFSLSEISTLYASLNELLQKVHRSRTSTGVLQHIIDGIDAYVYVTDPETDEILFINSKMAEHYGISGNAVGQTCWKVLQSGFTRRCDFCPNYKLEKNPDEPITWEEHSTVTGHYYRNTDAIIDWLDNTKVHLQHSVDITHTKVTEAALQKRLEQQELMSALSQSFISSADVSDLIMNALRMTGEFMGLSRAMVGVLDNETGVMSFQYAWYDAAQGLPPVSGVPVPFAEGQIEYEAFIKDKKPYLICNDTGATNDFDFMAEFGVKAILITPLYVKGVFWGVLGIDDCQRTRDWGDSDIYLMNLIGSVISGAISRSMTEEELLRMSAIVDSSPAFVAYLGAGGSIAYVNKGAMEISGYSEEEFKEGGITMLLDDQFKDYVLGTLIPQVREIGRLNFEIPIRRKDGAIRAMSVSVFKTDTKAYGFGLISSDITEKLQMERELIEAKEQAEQSSHAKGDFLSRMSHEMRTPMNAIIGMTNIALSAKEAEKKEYCLQKISDASNHLLGVINDILDMSKIEANKFELSMSELRFEKMLMRVVNVVNFRVDEKHQRLKLNIDSNVPHSFVSDEQRLAQVITNLLSNAVKFTPERGSVTLNVRKIDENESGLCHLRFEVEDTGIGISPEQQAKLFRSFEQADGGIARKFGGTGLGLAISKSIVELMGGRIWVESELGLGAKFIFVIPAQRGTDGDAFVLNSAVDWNNLRVMAVDDAPDVLEYFINFASAVGFNCATASSGGEALRVLEENSDRPFDVLFIDWNMPDMDGIDLTRKIRSKFGEHVFIIMISASQWNELEEDAKEAGVNRFISKPLFASALLDAITLGLAPKSGASTGETGEENPETGIFAAKHILLAEDVEVNREIVADLLEYTGLNIDYAENGQEAYDAFASKPDFYDMIFMDIHMPEMDGLESTRLIRAFPHPRARAIPIVAMTANVFREDIEKCLHAGMTDHVGKPLNMEDVMLKLRKYLDRG